MVVKRRTVRRKRPTTTSSRPKPSGIKKLSKRPKWVRIIVYAHPGVGKSVLAGSTVEVGRTLILNADGPDGPEAMRSHGYDPDILDVDDVKGLNEVLEWGRHGGWKEYDWVWLDSSTLWEDSDMDSIMRDLVREKPHRSVYAPDKPQFGLRQQHLSLWVRHMRAQPINFGMTSHVMSVGTESEDEDESTAQYMPAIQGSQGQLSSKICGNMGIVGRLHIRKRKVTVKGGGKRIKKERVLQVQPSGLWYAKDRFGVLGDEIVNPTMSVISEAINGRKA
jgi:hypothetical protein